MSQAPVQQVEMRTIRDQLMRVLALVRRSLRHFWKAVILVIIGGGIAAGVAVMKKKKFESSTTVLYRKLIHTSYVQGNNDTPKATSREVGLRLQEILLSKPSLRAIMKEFKLLEKVRDKKGWVAAVAKLRKQINFRVGGGDTFHISYTGYDPDKVQKVVTRLAQLLIAKDMELRSQQARMTQKFLADETERAQKFLAKKEKELANFLAKHPEFTATTGGMAGQAGAAGIGSAISARAKKQAAAAKKKGTGYSRYQLILLRQIARIRARLGQRVPKAVITRDPKFVAARNAARRNLREAQSRLANERQTKSAAHPDVRAAQRLVAAARARLARVTRALTASTTVTPAKGVDKIRLKKQLAALQRRFGATRSKKGTKEPVGVDESTKKLVALETTHSRLVRVVKEARDRYLKLETRQFRAGLKVAAETGGKAASMQVVDPAYKPTRPIGLGKTATVAVGLAVSMVFAGGLILVLGLMDDRLYDRLDVERLKVVDVLVEVPKGKRGWMKKRPKVARAAPPPKAPQKPQRKG